MTAPPTAAPPGLVAILSAGNFVIGMGAMVIVGLVPSIATGLQVGVPEVGGLLASYAVAYAILSPVLIAATGRIGRRRVMAAGLALFGLGVLLSALAPGLLSLHAARVLTAIGAGLYTPVAAAVAAGTVPPERRARALAAVFFGITLAQVVGIPVGAWIAYSFGWRPAFWCVAALTLPCIWLIWTRVPAGLSFPVTRLADLGAVLRDLPVMVSVLYTASVVTAVFTVYTYFAPLLEADMGFARGGVSLALVVFGLGAVGGNLLGGALADRLGPSRTLVLLALAQIVLLPVFSLLPLPAALFLAVLALWSVIGWSFNAGQQARLIGLAPQRASVVLSLNAASIYVGTATGAAIGAAVVRGPGLSALGWTAAGVSVLALGHLLLSERLGRRIRPAPATG